MLRSTDINWNFCSKRADYFDNARSICDHYAFVTPLSLTSTFIFVLSTFTSTSSAVTTSVGGLVLHTSAISFCFTEFLVPQRLK